MSEQGNMSYVNGAATPSQGLPDAPAGDAASDYPLFPLDEDARVLSASMRPAVGPRVARAVALVVVGLVELVCGGSGSRYRPRHHAGRGRRHREVCALESPLKEIW